MLGLSLYMMKTKPTNETASDDTMALSTVATTRSVATTHSSPWSMSDLVFDYNVHSNIVSQSINNPNLQINTVAPLSTTTVPALHTRVLICGSFIGDSIIRAQQQQTRYARPNIEDAQSYLVQVKINFANQPQVYNSYMNVMKDFKSEKIGPSEVIARVIYLFKDHPDLLLGFNKFLPAGYKIKLIKQ